MTDHRANPDFRALMACVRAAPRDDAPRHVIADWLLEHDDPWGEFVIMQLARRDFRVSRMGNLATIAFETDSGGVLYLDYDIGSPWMPAAAASWEWTWERGFPHRVRLPAEELDSVLPLLLEEWPVREVVVIEDYERPLLHGDILNQLRRAGVAFFTEPFSRWRGPEMTGEERRRVRAAARELERGKDKAAADRLNRQKQVETV